MSGQKPIIYREINTAIEKVVREGFTEAVCDVTGKYLKVKLIVSQIDIIYEILLKKPIPFLCDNMKKTKVNSQREELIAKFCEDQMALLGEYKKLPYEIGYDNERLEKVVQTLQVILDLNQNTYIGNFSTALYKDSRKKH